MKADIQQLRFKCPLPVLMGRLGLGRYVKSSCPSPFRPDENASWGIYERNGRWMYKDFGTGESGDEIALLAHIYQVDQKRDFPKLIDLYAEWAKGTAPIPARPAPTGTNTPPQKPDTSFLNSGTDEQMEKLSALRRISLEGLRYARERGVLKLGVWQDHEVFAVTDRSKCLGELRRLDGQMFPSYNSLTPHKSHTLKHSRKNWPLGILEADGPGIALVEGMPDFLAMHQFVVEEGVIGKVAPVAMLTSSCDIASDALPHFADKNVRIFPHLDEPGIDAAERWQKQLISAGANKVDFFNFRAFEIAAGSMKDLCDFNQQRGGAGIEQQRLLTTLAL